MDNNAKLIEEFWEAMINCEEPSDEALNAWLNQEILEEDDSSVDNTDDELLQELLASLPLVTEEEADQTLMEVYREVEKDLHPTSTDDNEDDLFWDLLS